MLLQFHWSSRRNCLWLRFASDLEVYGCSEQRRHESFRDNRCSSNFVHRAKVLPFESFYSLMDVYSIKLTTSVRVPHIEASHNPWYGN